MRKTISQLNMLSTEEYNRIVKSFNDTAADYPSNQCVHTWLEEQARLLSDRIAVTASDAKLTYKELNEQANRIAHSLISKGIQQGDIVAFMLPRKSYLLPVMFGILKSGAAYMPIDPEHPQDRVDYMLSDSNAKLCITGENLSGLLANEKTHDPNVQISSDSLCYCIYTSGSTGKPKGTLITHRNVVNFCTDSHKNYFVHNVISSCKTVVSTNSISFDIVLQEIHLPLLNGIPILLMNTSGYLDDQEISLLQEHTQMGLITTPVKIKAMMQNPNFCKALRNMSVIMIGADVLTQTLVDEVTSYSNADLYNGYGPTETTCGVTYSLIGPTCSKECS